MIKIFHLSDLHIDIELLPKLNIIEGFRGHNIEVWGAFRKHFKERQKEANENYICAITGDISSFGGLKSFNLAKQFIFDGDKSEIADEVGLKLPKDKVILIPGNHDSYNNKILGKNSLKNFNETFRIFEPYPITKVIEKEGFSISIIAFESSYLKNTYSPAKKLGRGIIEKEQYALAEGFLRTRKFNLRIVMLHHNPIFPPNTKTSWNLILEGSRSFIEWIIKNKIDFVFFGHIHDDFYDVLPLKSLMKLLPIKRGFGKYLRKIYLNTSKLNEYENLHINGEYLRQIDSIAYQYIINKRSNTLLLAENFNSKKEFENYLYELPEYSEFISDLNNLSKQETLMVMAGSLCQDNDKRKNSYIELDFYPDKSQITIYRHKYQPKKISFETKQRELNYNFNK
jgi:Icc-related predicted phosphoesterase